jgi:hypothetical protein
MWTLDWRTGEVKPRRPFGAARPIDEEDSTRLHERVDLSPSRCLTNEAVVDVNALPLHCLLP